jgi:hypothetical protein
VTCKSGYKLSNSGLCDESQDGYLKIRGTRLICIAKILDCLEYDISSEDSKCIECREGYMLDSNYKCSACELEYIEVSSDPLECVFKRDRCISYKRYDGDWVCDICEEGYKLDNEMNCNLCAEGYSSASEEVLEFILSDNSTPDNEDDSGSINEDTLEQDEEYELKTSNVMVKNSGNITKGAILASVSVSIVSLNLDSILSMIGTTQLLATFTL